MKVYATEAIRNLAVIGHGDAGKTQLISSLLYVAGATPRWGKVDEGTTVTDHDEDSIARKITLNTALVHLEHKETKVNLIDTPGYAAFVSHARPACRVADCGVVVVDGVKGVEVQTEKVWNYANEFMLPRLMVVTKLDKEHSDMGIALEEAKRMRLALPGLALANQLYLAVQAHGWGRKGTHALMLALEQLSNVKR